MSRELVTRTITPSIWQMVSAIAPTMHKSRLFGVASAEAAAAIMIKGYELGLGLSASFEFIQVIQGKPTLSPKGGLALIHRSGELASIKLEETEDFCTVTMRRTNGVEYTLTYGYEDAKRAGLIKAGSAWESYGPNMMRWRAIGFCSDIVFPDILGGLHRADEFGAEISTDGDVIDGEWTAPVEAPQPPPPTPAAELPAASGVTLDQLLEQYGAEKIIEVNEGKIPGEQAELEAVAKKLEAVGG